MSDKTVYSRRNPAIDMLRALTMFTMIFVNDFWKVHDVPHWLEHAVYGEDFMGLADIVFPCFLFAVGMSIPYAIERRYAKGFSAESTLGHILSRTFALLVMGAFITNSEFRLSPEAPYPIGVYWFLMAIGFIGVWNQYPKPASGTQKNLFRAFKIIGVLVLLYLAFTFRNPQEGVFGAYWGILGSIGWTYLVCAVIYFFSRDRLKYLLPIWGVFILICLLGTPLRESFGGEAILTFPERNFYQGMLGILHIGGLTKSEAENLIREKLKTYITEVPIVNVRMANYKISVMGEVTNPGSFVISNEKVNLFEALAMAGDMTIYGQRDNVKLIREDAQGHREIIPLNLNDASIILSPYYYLQQNDVIYVTPNKTKAKNAGISNSTTIWFSVVGTLVSLASLIVTISR